MNIHSTQDTPASPTQLSSNEVLHASPTHNPPLPAINLPSLQETISPKEVIPATANDSPEENADNSDNLLLVMSISVGDGKSYNLPVNENDDPYELARIFCKRHNLEDNVIEPLAQNIYSNMEQVLEASVNNPNPATHRDAQQSRREKSPFPRQSGDFLEPEHKEERFKRRVDTEEEEVLEQIEKPCSGEVEDSSKKIAQKALGNLLHNSKPNPKSQQRYDETSIVAKSGAVLESIYMDMSVCSTIRLGELVDDNKLIENIRRMELQNSVRNPEKNDKEPSGKEERFSSNPKLRTEVINLITEEEVHEKSQTDRHGMLLKSSSEAKLGANKYRAISPIKSYNELEKFTPKKSPNTDRSYRQIFQQKEAQKPRQRSSEFSAKKRNTSTLESSRAANMSATNLGSVTNVTQNKNSQNKDDGTKKETMTRAKSASRLRSNEELSFKPKINKQSEKIVNEKQKQRQSLGATPHQRLFNHHKSREAQLEQKSQIISEECTFKPNINSYVGTPIGRMSFHERNKYFQGKVKEQKELMSKKELLDTSTGKPLFRPATGRPPSTNRNREKLPIGDYLYKQRGFGEKGDPLNTSSTRDHNSSLIQHGTTERSHQTAFERKAIKKLEDLFQNLDSDKDGYISAENVDINPIDTFDLQVIAPILCAMEEQNQTLYLETFIEETIKAIKNLSIHERDHFLFGERRSEAPKDNEKFAFKPQINKRSAELAKSKRPSGDFNALYEKLMKEKREKEERIRREQEKKRESELQYCSFQPQVNRKSYRPPVRRENENEND